MSNIPQADTTTIAKDAEEKSKRAWQHFAKKEYESALVEFREALRLNANLIDAVYGFAMTLRYKGESAQALKAFEQVQKMVEDGVVSDANRIEMLARLAKSHIAFLKKGSESPTN